MSEATMHAAADTAHAPPRTARPEKDVLSRKEAADYLTRKFFPCAAQTLANLASNNNEGGGPKFTRVGWCHVQYQRADLDSWARARMVSIG